MSPFAYVRFLETFYARIAEVLESHSVNEIETAAGECLVVSGLPDRIPKHCSEVNGKEEGLGTREMGLGIREKFSKNQVLYRSTEGGGPKEEGEGTGDRRQGTVPRQTFLA